MISTALSNALVVAQDLPEVAQQHLADVLLSAIEDLAVDESLAASEEDVAAGRTIPADEVWRQWDKRHQDHYGI